MSGTNNVSQTGNIKDINKTEASNGVQGVLMRRNSAPVASATAVSKPSNPVPQLKDSDIDLHSSIIQQSILNHSKSTPDIMSVLANSKTNQKVTDVVSAKANDVLKEAAKVIGGDQVNLKPFHTLPVIGSVISSIGAVKSIHEARTVGAVSEKCKSAASEIETILNNPTSNLSEPQKQKLQETVTLLKSTAGSADNLVSRAKHDAASSGLDLLGNAASLTGGAMQFADFTKHSAEAVLTHSGVVVGGAAGIFTGTIGLVKDSVGIDKLRRMQNAAESFQANPFQSMLNKNDKKISTLKTEIQGLEAKLAKPEPTGLKKMFSTSHNDLKGQLELKKREMGLVENQNTTLAPKAAEYASATPDKKVELTKDVSNLTDISNQIKEVSKKAKWMKAVSIVKNVATIAAGVVGIVAVATAMTTPVGWALVGGAGAIAVGLGIAKLVGKYKNANQIQQTKARISELKEDISSPRLSERIRDNSAKELKQLESKLIKIDPKIACHELLKAINSPNPEISGPAKHLAENVLRIGDISKLKIDINNPLAMGPAMKYLGKKMPGSI